MNNRPNDLTDAEAESGRWLPLAEAAGPLGARTAEALRQRIRRDRTRYRWRKSDRGDLLVWVDRPDVRLVDQPDGRSDATGQPDQPAGQPDAAEAAALLAERDVQLARLEERLAASDEARAELRERIESLERRLDEAQTERRLLQEAHEAEVDRLLTVVEQLAAEPPTPARRPWPGLRAWLRKVWEGEG